MYKEAVERNVHASSVDHDYLAHRKLTGMYPPGHPAITQKLDELGVEPSADTRALQQRVLAGQPV